MSLATWIKKRHDQGKASRTIQPGNGSTKPAVTIVHSGDEEFLATKAHGLENWLAARDYPVISTSMPEHGQHPHAAITESMFTIQEVFAWLCCFFSGILVYNLFSMTMERERRQIGVMKAPGGSTFQIGGIYFSSVISLGLVGLAAGMPLAVLAGRFYAGSLAPIMNLDIINNAVPLWIYGTLVAVGLGVPMLAAAVPIRRATQAPIRDSLVEYGMQQDLFGLHMIDRLLNLPLFSRPLRLCLRNTFRKKGRLLLTITVLGAGAAMFIAAVNLKATMKALVADERMAKAWDIALRLSRDHPTDAILQSLRSHRDITMIEPYSVTPSTLLDEAGRNALSLPVTNLVPSSTMIHPPILQGQWLDTTENGLVISQAVVKKLPWLSPGGHIAIRPSGKTQSYTITGVVKMLGGARAYSQQSLADIQRIPAGTARGFLLKASRHERDYLYDFCHCMLPACHSNRKRVRQ